MSSGEAADGVTSAMLDCIHAEAQRQDAALNQAYKMVMARLKSDQQATLRSSERAWISTRDKDCNEAAEEEAGGTLAVVIHDGCLLDETIKRTMYLENYL